MRPRFSKSIMDTVHSAFFVLDMDLRVQSANRALYRTFDVTENVTVGCPLFELGN